MAVGCEWMWTWQIAFQEELSDANQALSLREVLQKESA